MTSTLSCSFCGKRSDHVVTLIAGPSSFICDECIELCSDIIREGKTERAVKEAVAKETDRIINRMQSELLSLGAIGIIRKSGSLHRWLAEKVRA